MPNGPGIAKVFARAPISTERAGYVLDRKHKFEELLRECGFDTAARTGYEIARTMRWSPETLRCWRDVRDLTRHPSDAAFERLEQYREMLKLRAQFGGGS